MDIQRRRLDAHWHALYPSSAPIEAHEHFAMDNRGLAYGDGFFTTMAVQAGLIGWADYHRQRVQQHAAALSLQVATDALWQAIKAQAEQMGEGMLKLIITRAPQHARGYGVTPDAQGGAWQAWLKSMPHTLAHEGYQHLPNGQRVLKQAPCAAVCLRAQLACLPAPLAGLKSLNCLDNVLACAELERIKATDSRIGEALVSDVSGQWVEGSASNVFYQLQHHDAEQAEQWYTPPLTQSGVAGVMRQVIIDGYAKSAQPISMRALHDDDLPNLRALFFCNAVKGIIPISALHLRGGDVLGLASAAL